MKKTILILTALFIINSVNAQQSSENETGRDKVQDIQTIFSNPVRVGWWASMEFSYTQFDGRSVYLVGGSGGIIINHSFSIGLIGYGITNSGSLMYQGIDTTDLYLYGGYGGLRLEYRIAPMKAVNIAFPLLIGGSGLSYSSYNWNNYNYNHDSDGPYAWDSNFVIEPGIVIGVNVFKFMRLDAGASYRYAPGLDLPETSSSLLNGFNATLSLKFGKF